MGVSQQAEANIVLQQQFEIMSEQNIRLKKIEEDYILVAKHIDADYSETNRLMAELREKSKEKEEELAKIKGFIAQKENENSKLQKHVVQSSQTIKELQDMLEEHEQPSYQEEEFAHEKMAIRQDLDSAEGAKIESLRSEMNMMISNKEKECEALRGELRRIKNDLVAQQQLVEETKSSKVKLVSNFATEMNRIRGEIKKQNKSRNSIIRSS